MLKSGWGWGRIVLAVGVATVMGAPSAWAGAWTLPRDRWYVEYFFRYFYSKHTYDRDGNKTRRPAAGRFTDIRNELKFEYGITDWWNLLGSMPYISAQFKDDNNNLLRTGIQDIYLRSKFRLFNAPVFVDGQPFVVSSQFSLKVPAGYDKNENPLGDGQIDFESRLQLSQSWAFSPYHARVPQRRAGRPAGSGSTDTLEERAAAMTAALALNTPVIILSRDDALRDAIRQAEMMQRGTWLYAEGDYTEAAKWFQAVLQEQPANFEIKRVVLNHAARSMAVASLDGPPYVVPAAADRYEPIPTDDWEQTTTHYGDRLDPEAGPWEDDLRYEKVAFVNLEGGYTLRRGDPPDEFPLVAEAGFTPWKRLMLIGSLDSVVSEKSDPHEESFVKWGLRGVWNLWGDGFASVFRTGGPTVNLEFGYNEVFDGRNTADAHELFTKLAVFF